MTVLQGMTFISINHSNCSSTPNIQSKSQLTTHCYGLDHSPTPYVWCTPGSFSGTNVPTNALKAPGFWSSLHRSGFMFGGATSHNIYLSICLSVCLSIYLSIYLYLHTYVHLLDYFQSWFGRVPWCLRIVALATLMTHVNLLGKLVTMRW